MAPSTVPVLVIQGEQDQYGTTAQVQAVVQNVNGPIHCELLPDCRHSPYIDQPIAVLARIRDFLEHH